jgi:4'-phosphopantetheinyl transferase
LRLFPLVHDDAAVAAARGLLSPDERRRADRLADAGMARRFAVGRAIVRLAVAGGRDAAAALELGVGAGGKPFCIDPARPRFNLAHTGNTALLAVSHFEVGVDIEAARTLPDVDAMAQQVLSGAECRRLSSIGPADRCRQFLRLWTCKEAVLKADGAGFGRDPRQIDLGPQSFGRLVDRQVELDRVWRVSELDLGEALVGAVAAEAGFSGPVHRLTAAQVRQWLQTGVCPSAQP